MSESIRKPIHQSHDRNRCWVQSTLQWARGGWPGLRWVTGILRTPHLNSSFPSAKGMNASEGKVRLQQWQWRSKYKTQETKPLWLGLNC